ncbi:MAG: ABC transporter substrate-binding protein [Acidobacteriota bacterium]
MRRPRSFSRIPIPLATCLVLTLLLGVGCGDRSDDAPAEPAGPTTVVVAYDLDIESPNELVASTQPIHTMLHHIALFLPLAEEQADYQDGPPSFKPQLAESWETSEDGLAITFNLRRDAVWSDGEPITAEDVRFTWQAQIDPDIAWSFAEFKKRVRDVEVIDPHTARFHFTELHPNLFFEAVQGVILPKHAWGELPFAEWRGGADWFFDHLVTSGPFVLESREPGQRFVLAKNPRFYEPGVPEIDRVVFEVVPERSNQLNMLRAGTANFVEFVDYADAETLAEDPAIELTTFIPRNYYFVAWNTVRQPFDDARVRRALTLGIDRWAIIDTLFYGYGQVSWSPLATNVWAHHDGLEPWPYDPAAARELLAEAGFVDSDDDGSLDRDGEPLRFVLETNAENELRRNIVVMIQSQLERIGIDVEVRTPDFGSLGERLYAGDFDAVVAGVGIGTDLDLTYNFHTSGTQAFNWGQFSDPEIDAMIETIVTGGTLDEQKARFFELQERIHELQPVTFLYQGTRLGAVRRPLTNTRPDPISSFSGLEHWRVETNGDGSDGTSTGE